jgi:TupA-like ATPgrasp
VKEIPINLFRMRFRLKIPSRLANAAERLERWLPDALVVRLQYLIKIGKLPDVRNPKGFNEKIAWRKLFQRNPRFTILADKYLAKREVEKCIGAEYIIPTLWAGEDPCNIPFERLDPPYVIKPNHASGGHVFIRSRAQVSGPTILNPVLAHLRIDFWKVHREWGYKDIKRLVIVEPWLEPNEGSALPDYKFFVYDGHVHFIQVDLNRFGHHVRAIFDRHWRELPVTFVYPRPEVTPQKPLQLKKMLGIAEKLGAGFDFVRVDLYAPAGRVFFGEMTFYPEGGLGQFDPPIWDCLFGRPWILGSTVALT